MLASYLGFMDQYHPGHKQGKRQQPTHPSMVLPSLADGNLAGSRWQPRRGPQDQRVPHLSQSIFRDAPNRMTSSMMMRSSLLDHHHQPAPAGFGTARSTRFHPPNKDVPLKEEEDEEESPQTGSQGYHDRGAGQLGESFVSQGVEETDVFNDDGESGSSGASAGVLGLLNQFVAAHGEGGGTRAGVAVM